MMQFLWRFWRAQFTRKTTPLFIVAFLSFLTSVFVQVPSLTESYIYRKWRESAQYADVIVGYKGSPLQIVANTLFRLENPTGNLPEESVNYWKKHPMVLESCAGALGDNIQGYPIVGTDSNYFDWMNISLEEGRLPSTSGEIVVSKLVANRLGLHLGDHLHSSHGSDANGEAHDHHHLTLVGFIKADRAADNESFFVPTAAYYDMHSGKGKGKVTALMLRLKSKSALVMLPRVFETRPNEQGAFPVFIFAGLQKQWAPTLEKMRTWGMLVPLAIAILFVAFMYFLARTEREARSFLVQLKTPRMLRYLSLYGLPILFALFGYAIHLLIFYSVDLGVSLLQALLALIPIALSTLILTRIRS